MTGSEAASISFSAIRSGPAWKQSKRSRVIDNLDSANLPNPYVSYCSHVVDLQGWLTCSSRKHTAEPDCAGKRPRLAEPVHNSRLVKQASNALHAGIPSSICYLAFNQGCDPKAEVNPVPCNLILCTTTSVSALQNEQQCTEFQNP
jgi:hypothetical protein